MITDTPKRNMAMHCPGTNYTVAGPLADWIAAHHRSQGNVVIVGPDYLRSLVRDGIATKVGDTYHLLGGVQ